MITRQDFLSPSGTCTQVPVKTPERAIWGGYSSFLADPDGHLWELAHKPFTQLDENGNIIFRIDR